MQPLAYGSISRMTELTDVPGAFGYGDSILVGDRVRLRGVRDDDLPTLAKWEMDPGRTATLRNWVVLPSEASAREYIAKWSANQKDDLAFAIETLEDPPLLIGRVELGGARPKDRCAEFGIALGREYIGRGYGSDATRVMVDYGFREMGLHRIQLGVVSFNLAGIRAYPHHRQPRLSDPAMAADGYGEGSSPTRYTSFRPAKSEDEKSSVHRTH
jgi:RimJ/RimL family protein N-acetyltransferase